LLQSEKRQMTTPDVQLLWDCACLLGEGPLWLPEANTLKFVDIKGGAVCTFAVDGVAGSRLQTGANPSFIVPSDDGDLLVGSRNAVHRLTESGFGSTVVTIPEPAGNRTNDATVDAAGRLWFGTMDDAEATPSGAIWRFDGHDLYDAGPRAVVTNGPALSGDGNLLYHVDSGGRTIWRCAVNDDGSLSEGQVFVHIEDGAGYPDGVITDAEDCLWVALWDGWAVRRYAPDGTLMLQVPIPCARPTKIALGGPNLTTAFVTSARIGIDADALADQPHAGGLFSFEAPAPGRVLPAVRMR